MTASCACGATWNGTKLEHCSAHGCHQTFGGTKAGDMHRVGSPDQRRCLTIDEMLAKGLVSREDKRSSTPVWGREAENWSQTRTGTPFLGLPAVEWTQPLYMGSSAKEGPVCGEAS